MTKTNDTKNDLVRGFALKAGVTSGSQGSVEVDVSRYAPYLEDSNLTEAQKEEIIQALWSIMVAFVDLGFGIHPVRQGCGQLAEIGDESPDTGTNKVQCEHALDEEFDSVAGREPD